MVGLSWAGSPSVSFASSQDLLWVPPPPPLPLTFWSVCLECRALLILIPDKSSIAEPRPSPSLWGSRKTIYCIPVSLSSFTFF